MSGRDFDAGDVTGGRRVVIVNETFARTYFPDGDATGRAIDLIDITTNARAPRRSRGCRRWTRS